MLETWTPGVPVTNESTSPARAGVASSEHLRHTVVIFPPLWGRATAPLGRRTAMQWARARGRQGRGRERERR